MQKQLMLSVRLETRFQTSFCICMEVDQRKVSEPLFLEHLKSFPTTGRPHHGIQILNHHCGHDLLRCPDNQKDRGLGRAKVRARAKSSPGATMTMSQRLKERTPLTLAFARLAKRNKNEIKFLTHLLPVSPLKRGQKQGWPTCTLLSK